MTRAGGRFTGFHTDDHALRNMLDWAEHRIRIGPDPTHGAQTKEILAGKLGATIQPNGLGWDKAFSLFSDVIVPSSRPFDHPTSLAFVAAAPSSAAQGIDAALGAAEIFAGNWDGGSGAIYAENQVIEWLAGLAGWTSGAGGAFVSGGTQGNLSALHAARVSYNSRHERRPDRYRIVCSEEAHSSIDAIAAVMDAEIIHVSTDSQGRVVPAAVGEALQKHNGIFAIVANAGATNCGAVDNLEALADLAREYDTWLHVDGAYGLAALADPACAKLFQGLDRADSFIVDPHKWLFAPYDSCALVYREARRGSAAHGQKGVYLDALNKSRWNPSDFALHLTRRPRGLPLWFSLVVYGTQAYAEAIQTTRTIAKEIADGIDELRGLTRILGPQLTVILFRVDDISDTELNDWCEENRRSGALLCLPTKWRGETVLRICVVNPATDPDQVLSVLATLT